MLMDDWDLHAVVRGCCTSSASTSSTTIATPTINTTTCGGVDFAWFPPLDLVQEDERINAFSSFSSSISNRFESRTGALEDLEQLCKPFLPSPPPPPVNLTNPITVTASSSTPPSLLQNPKSEFTRRSVTSPTPSSSTSTPRPKRRKNQQKKVVCQVPAEGLSSDMWAWRKYGQKPIKGSPYPRGYYRCSSSKGCLARKQVERSRSDPSMFIITYTAEHNHPVPTHRNSLAGSTRNKVSTSAQRATTSDGATTTTTTNTTTTSKPSCSSSSPLTGFSPTTGLSPTTPLSIEEDQLLHQKEEGEEIDQDDDGDDLLHIPEGCDDMFMDFEEFNESTGAPSSATNPTTTADQFQANFSWITS